MQANKQKIVICGATGFIGRNLVEHFAKRPEYAVHAIYHRRPPYAVQGDVTWHQADLRDPKQVDAILADKDVLIQAAATTSGAKDIVEQPHLHVTDNAVMNAYLFRSAFEHKLKHVVFFSCTVMYHSADLPLRESDFDANLPLNPRYFGVGHTKLYTEKMAEFFARHSDTRFTVLRHSNVYGPHDKFDLEKSHVFGATVTKVLAATDSVSVWGTGEEARDLLYIDDLVSCVHLALLRQTTSFQLFHCGSGKAVSIRQLVEKIIQASGKLLRIAFDTTKPTIQTRLCLDCTLAKTVLGWQPQVSLEMGIEKTLAWVKDKQQEVVA